MNRILVYHRNGLFRDCLVTFLTKSLEYDAVSMDHRRSEHLDPLCTPENAGLVLVDLNLPDNLAIEITRSIKAASQQTKVIVLVPDDHNGLLACISAGVHGCVLERASLEDLDLSISKALQGETVCSPDFAATIFSELSRVTSAPSWQTPASASRARLTQRELEVLELLAKRSSNKQIAKELCLSLYTVKNHVHNILEKLSVDSRLEAVDYARRENWLVEPRDGYVFANR